MLSQLNAEENCKTSFPVKLYTMLELFDGKGNASHIDRSEIVAWSPHGRAFEVRDEARFMSEVSPLFFRQTKISSFYRQLHLWGFRRFSKGRDCGSWYNGNFLRGQPGQLKNMLRIKIKKNVGAKHARARPEPDLYALPPLTARRSCSKSQNNELDSNRSINTNHSNSSRPRLHQQISANIDEFTWRNSVELGCSQRNKDDNKYTRKCSIESFQSTRDDNKYTRKCSIIESFQSTRRDSFVETIEAMEFCREAIGGHAQPPAIEPLPMHEICSIQDMEDCVEVIDRTLVRLLSC